MALKRLMRRPSALDESLAVPFPGAMALKRPQDTPRRTSPTLAVPFPGAMALKLCSRDEAPVTRVFPCSPLPRGDGAETSLPHDRTARPALLAVPFPGAMALKQRNNLVPNPFVSSCSPLPRGDGAETG